MTCAHVLGIIDAGPFADCSPADLAAARAHAMQCATCGMALATADAMTSELPGEAPDDGIAAEDAAADEEVSNTEEPGADEVPDDTGGIGGDRSDAGEAEGEGGGTR